MLKKKNLLLIKLMFQNTFSFLFLLIISILLVNCKNKSNNTNTIEQQKKVVQTENEPLKNIAEKFTPIAIGNTFEEPPQISNLTVGDMNQDDLLDVIVCV